MGNRGNRGNEEVWMPVWPRLVGTAVTNKLQVRTHHRSRLCWPGATSDMYTDVAAAVMTSWRQCSSSGLHTRCCLCTDNSRQRLHTNMSRCHSCTQTCHPVTTNRNMSPCHRNMSPCHRNMSYCHRNRSPCHNCTGTCHHWSPCHSQQKCVSFGVLTALKAVVIIKRRLSSVICTLTSRVPTVGMAKVRESRQSHSGNGN